MKALGGGTLHTTYELMCVRKGDIWGINIHNIHKEEVLFSLVYTYM